MTSNPFQNTGVVNGRHTLITHQGSDPNTGGQLPLLPPGESSVIRLGNERTGAEAEAITYRFIVDDDAAILLLKFAVVLQDPSHLAIHQPRFVVRVLDGNGQLVEDCAEYAVSAGAGIPGFQTYSGFGGPIRWRPWTNVGIDLSHFIGREVRVQFVTYDCDWYGHFGYAYFTASCISNRLDLVSCNGQTVTLAAPPDFDSYHWSNGSTQRTTQYTVTGQNLDAYCDITSATGCQFTLCAHISNESGLPTHDMTVYDTICEGEAYNDHYFNLPVQNESGAFTYVTTLFNLNNCTGNIDITLFLTVLQTYYNTYYDDVCQGEDYVGHGFSISAEQLQDSLDAHPTKSTFLFSRYVSAGLCQPYVRLYLTVNPAFTMPNQIAGDFSPCIGELTEYRVLNGDGLSHYNWVIPTGVTLISGQGTPCIKVIFDDATPQTITLQGENGCGNGAIPIVVTPKQSYHLFFDDTICSGNTYDGYGFHLARQDNIGCFTFINSYPSVTYCDSLRVLQLLVTGTPSLTMQAEPTVICGNGSTTIHALGDYASIVQGGNGSVTPPEVAVGDIVCTDGSIVKPANWPCGKTAKGIVFYVDDTGRHGWIVHLQNCGVGLYGSNKKWGNLNDIYHLTNYNNYNGHDAVTDYDGYGNTEIIRTYLYNNNDFAAWVVDFANGWYLPAIGQLRMLWGNLSNVDASLAVVGGQVLLNDYCILYYYWSSDECDYDDAWAIDYKGNLMTLKKNESSSGNHSYKVRSVSNF